MKVSMSTAILSDHISRLYEVPESLPSGSRTYVHVDEVDLPAADAEKILIVDREGKVTSVVAMSPAAVREFIDDMEYQIECCEDDFQREYVKACKRALAQVKKVDSK